DVSRIGQTGIETLLDEANRTRQAILGATCTCQGVVSRRVINDDNLDRRIEQVSRAIDRLNTAFDKRRVVVESDDDGDLRSGGAGKFCIFVNGPNLFADIQPRFLLVPSANIAGALYPHFLAEAFQFLWRR